MKAEKLYPEFKDGDYEPGDYSPIIKDLGNVLVRVDDKDYQGDSRALIESEKGIGVLIFGWGSCSGCDALQSCDTVKELDRLIERIQSDTKWFKDKQEALNYFKTHDWEGDYSWHQEETKEFIEKSIKKLENLTYDIGSDDPSLSTLDLHTSFEKILESKP